MYLKTTLLITFFFSSILCAQAQYNPKVFDNMDNQRIEEKFQKIKLIESKIDWSKFIYLDSYLELGKEFTLDQGHPSKKSHAIIADLVIEFLDQYKQFQSL